MKFLLGLQVVPTAIHGIPEPAVLGEPHGFDWYQVPHPDPPLDLIVGGAAWPPLSPLRAGHFGLLLVLSAKVVGEVAAHLVELLVEFIRPPVPGERVSGTGRHL